MIIVTYIHTGQTATIDSADFTETVTPWFPDATAEVRQEIAEVQHALNSGTFIAGSANGSLGLDISVVE
ncbi:hypothetical protein NDR87_18735 [Nocardia sp. CDC159]|uniref:Uncharacterized protein n=1 Tax=Nocardia pulmonis TaxID=2951408 RepID=A0A9X2IYD4_9NOCA|nr:MULTISPECIES: hypothetical protein [Nocardia]MCM6776273.1 hypothetical protein [Nocardia pulmonis]MCM6788401.1 hypothetical protein [Nocardia sp. CDC159]